MTHDDHRGSRTDRQFQQAAGGLFTSRMCAFCHQPRPPGGGKVIGAVRRFKCVRCVEANKPCLGGQTTT
jgi:hypothetical protein